MVGNMTRERKNIMLILTDNCNLRCTYCYEGGNCKNTMSFEVAKKIIDDNFSALRQGDKSRIEFFGGEALICFPIIKEVYEYVEDTYPFLSTQYAFTTNGTLMHGKIKDWFWEHRERFVCTLSLDGTPEMHDLNRKTQNGQGSFEKIDIEFFRKAWPGCQAKMTISKDTLPNLAAGVQYIESLGFYCKATYASGIEWDMEQNLTILERELTALVKYYSENEIHLCSLLDLDLRAIFCRPDIPFRYCGAGLDRKCFDMSGRCYPCQGLASVAVGEEKAKLFENETFTDFCLSKDNPCYECKWLRICRTCFAANYLETGSIEHNCLTMCTLNRMAILASSAIQFQRIMKKAEKTPEELMTLKAVGVIQREVLQEFGLKEK